MSAASRLPVVAGTLSLGAFVAGLAALPSVREFAFTYFGSRVSKNMWKIAALVLALANFKNLPGVWHIRVLRGIIYQLYFQPNRQTPRHLFAPMITASRNTLYDCDYNGHKSNSTYFADLDVARAHHMGCIIRTGLARLNRGDQHGLSTDIQNTKGQYFVALGAVSCFFQREIKPLEEFEIFTRVLSWDRKWLYLVSHIIKKGAIKPDGYVLQPWKKSKQKLGKVKKEQDDLSRCIFATSVSRYVFKKGRLTINPEIILERSRLLPQRPEGEGLPPRSEGADTTPSATPATNGSLTSPENVASEVSSRLGGFVEYVGEQRENEDDWTWENMEQERLRGLQIAMHFDKLSACHNELRDGEVLGQYGDYW